MYICTVIVYLINMSKISPKHSAILSTGKELFWKHGIKRVTVEEICEKAGVSKMTFYKYFTNKNELVREIISQLIEDGISKMDEISQMDIPYAEKAKMMIMLKLEGTNEISKEFMADYYTLNDPDLIEFLNNGSQEVFRKFMASVIEAQEKGEVRKEINPSFIMYFFNHMPSMASDPALMELYPNGQDLIMELLRFFFYGILKNGNQDA